MQDSGRHAFLKNSVTIPNDRKPQRGSSMGDICFYGLKKLKETLVLCTHL